MKILLEDEIAKQSVHAALQLYREPARGGNDGIVEAADSEGHLFGEERLCALLSEHNALSPLALVQRLVDRPRVFTGAENFNDDVSPVILQVG